MSAVPGKKDSGIVLIHGREYQTVAYRVSQFREKYPLWSLVTEAIKIDVEVVVMKATIMDESGRVIATGHAEEYRSSSTINKTSALENSETSAIGRCLAAFGLGGTEFATADEVANAITSKPQAAKGVIKPTDGAMESLTASRRNVVLDTSIQVTEHLAKGSDFDAYGVCESLTDPDEKVALWSLLDSKARSRIKAAAAAQNR